MTLREELGQLSWAAKQYRGKQAIQRQWSAIRHMELPSLPRSPRGRGQVWAVCVARDEADVIGATVSHLLDQGVDQVLVADNMSQDTTVDVLRALGKQTGKVHIAADREKAHTQAQKMTWLAHMAWRHGADWIIPFDADEFWFARGTTVSEYLRATRTAGIVHAQFLHMVPTTPVPTRLTEAEFMMDCHPSHPGKVAVRSHRLLYIGPGNHYACRVGGETSGLFIAHAQYRGPEQVARKVRQGTQAARLTGEDLSWFSPHWLSGAQLSEDEIQAAWDNISSGRPEPRLQFAAHGPMLRLHPLTWRTWDPDQEIARAQEDPK